MPRFGAFERNKGDFALMFVGKRLIGVAVVSVKLSVSIARRDG